MGAAKDASDAANGSTGKSNTNSSMFAGLASIKGMAGKVAKGGLQIVTTGASIATNAASNVANVGVSGMTGIMSSGQGFRDFILRSNVVDLAVAVVIGMAFTNLIQAFTTDFITPAMGAIFAGTNLTELSFTVNGSVFKYGDFIAAIIVFLLIVLVLYYGVVNPLQKLMYRVYKNKALTRDCPYCLEEICLLATRCKHCSGEITATAEEVAEMSKALKAYNLPKIHCSNLTSCFRGRSATDAAPTADQVAADAADQQDLMHRFSQARLGGVMALGRLSTASRALSFVSASEPSVSELDIEAQVITGRRL